MNTHSFMNTAGVVGGRAVVVGNCEDLSDVEVYFDAGWIELPFMPHPVYSPTACMLNGRLYVVGGEDYEDEEAASKLQVLEMKGENGLAWSRKADLPAHRRDAASVVHEGKIWVMGGYVEDEGLSASVIVYDAEADAWDTAPPLPRACAKIFAATLDGRILVFDVDRARGFSAAVFEYADGAWSESALGSFVERPTCGSVVLG